jgi:hypothetical protein
MKPADTGETGLWRRSPEWAAYRFLVASPSVRDLLLCAKDLFGAASRVRSAMAWGRAASPAREGGAMGAACARALERDSAFDPTRRSD